MNKSIIQIFFDFFFSRSGAYRSHVVKIISNPSLDPGFVNNYLIALIWFIGGTKQTNELK